MQEELVKGEYRHSHYTSFTIYDPKKRHISKACVKDRVIHQALVNIIEPIFERRFIFDSFSCRKGKGIHGASKRLHTLLRRVSKNNTRTIYALKCDIKKFFDSVDHKILFKLLRRRIDDAETENLLLNIINSFSKTTGKGLPIGNLTSQLFANIYMHELDYFVKQILKEKYYIRYCDDFIILSSCRKHLFEILAAINNFLKMCLAIEIHPKKISIKSWGQGIDFVGFVHMPHCVVLRPKTKKRVLHRVEQRNLASYLGLCIHANTFELQQIVLTKAANVFD